MKLTHKGYTNGNTIARKVHESNDQKVAKEKSKIGDLPEMSIKSTIII
jgi:hypothetical protein